MKKTLLSLILTLVSLTTFAYDFKVGGIYYNITSSSDKACEVTSNGSSDSYSGAVVIPSSITYNSTTYTVSSIGARAFNGCSGLTSVTIPNSVTSIGFYTFSGCSGLTSVTIPNSVTSIGYCAFHGCTGLYQILLPEGLKTISDGAFEYCTSLKSITIPSTVTKIGEFAFEGCSGTLNIKCNIDHWFHTYENIEGDEYIISWLTGAHFTNIVIEQGVTRLSGYGFGDCSDLKSITLPSTLTEVEDGAFEDCKGTLLVKCNIGWDFDKCYYGWFYESKFTDVIIARGVESIGTLAFHDCSTIRSVFISEDVNYIDSRAFQGCTGLTSITCLPETPPTCNGDVFYGVNKNNGVSLNIRAQSESLYRDAVEWKEFPNIQSSLIGGGRCLDYLIWMLKENGTLTIGGNGDMAESEYSFPWSSYKSSIKKLIVQEGVTSIASQAFRDYPNLIDISIPNSVAVIGDMAFYNCEKLETIQGENASDDHRCLIMNNTLTVFAPSGLTTYTVPDNVVTIGQRTFSRSQLTTIILPEGLITLGDDAFSDCSSLENIVIPSTVTNIRSGVFSYCTSLKSLDIPSNVRSIGSSAFFGCERLSSITLHEGLASLGDEMFWGCYNLKSITIPSTVEYIGKNLLVNSGVKTLNVNCNIASQIVTYQGWFYNTKVTDVYVGDDVTTIGRNAFYDSSLKSIRLPESLSQIESQAFYYCSNLSDVTCLSLSAPTITSTTFSTYGTLHVLPGCGHVYEAANYWKNFTIVEDAVDPSMRRITFGASDYATYCSDANLDFSEVEGLKAYIASSYNPGTGSLTITRVDNVPAGEGMLLKGTAGESYDVPTTDNISVVANLMKGNTEAITLNPTDGDYTNFVLSKNGEGVMGFYRFNKSVTMPANKAWLQIPTSALGASPTNAKGFRLVEEGEDMTGVSIVEGNADDSSIIYDLQGRRLNGSPARGLYIRNGKKFIK